MLTDARNGDSVMYVLTSIIWSSSISLHPSRPTHNTSSHKSGSIHKDLLRHWIKRQTDDGDDAAQRSKKPIRKQI